MNSKLRLGRKVIFQRYLRDHQVWLSGAIYDSRGLRPLQPVQLFSIFMLHEHNGAQQCEIRSALDE